MTIIISDQRISDLFANSNVKTKKKIQRKIFFILSHRVEEWLRSMLSDFVCARAREYRLGLNSLVQASSECKFSVLNVGYLYVCGATTA